MFQEFINLYLISWRVVIPIFSLILIGLLLKKLHIISQEGEKTLMRLVVSVLCPCLIFSVIIQFDLNKQMSPSVMLAPLFGFGVTVLGYTVCLFVMRVLKTPSEYARSFSASTGLFNFGYMAIPTCELIFGCRATAMLLIFNIGVDVALWLIGVPMLRGGWCGGIKGFKNLISAPIAAIAISVPLSALGAAQYIPTTLIKSTQWLGQCTIPIALLAMGGSIYELIHTLKWQASWRTGMLSCLLRLGLLPTAFIILAYFCTVELELKQALIIQAGMPGGMLSIMLAKHYQVSPQTAVQCSVWTTAVSIITLPAWISLGIVYVL